MTPDALHGITHHPLTLIAVLCLGAATPVLGWGLAMALVGPRSRAGRAARAVGLAAWVLFPAALCIRLAAILAGGAGLTPLLAPLGGPAGGWHPHDAIVLLVLPLAALHLVCTELAALLERSSAPRALSVPLGLPVALVCIVAAGLGSLFGMFSLQQTLTELVAAEVFAVAPVALVALAIWTQTWDATPASAEEAAPEDPATTEHVDIPKRWRKVGALLEGARSFVKQAGSTDTTASPGQQAWNAVGGAGACPELLDSLAKAAIPSGEAWQVGDLPAPTEALLVTAALQLALRTHHLQVLVIGEDPEASAALLQRADTVAGGHWPVGPTVTGLAGLRQALADGRLPAVAFLTTEDLSGGAIRALDRGSKGELWARGLGLIVLEGFDRGGPLALTHRIHTLRRLRLVLDQHAVRCGILLTSHRSRAVRTLVQQAFNGVQVQDVPLRPRSTRALTVWLADYHFVLRSPSGWVRQAAEPVAKAGHRVRVSDPSGSFDDASLQVWQGDVRRTSQFTLEGEASVGLLDAPMLIAAWRALPLRVAATEDRGRHHALWSLIDEPVTRFLLADDRLSRLLASDELPAPAAVAALDNRLIARGHVRAALHEATQEHAALAAAFGASLVDELLAEHPGAVGHGVRPVAGGVIRTPRLKPNAEDPGDPLAAIGQGRRRR